LSPSPTVDTRFFLTHFLAEAESLREKSKRKITELQRENAFVPTIVIHEIYKFEYENSGVAVADLRINSILKSTFRIVDLTVPIAIAAAKLRTRHRGLPTADSIIAATALELKSKRVVSDDPHFSKIEGVATEWI
jgi:predicted nucleic acid-binding protein